MRKGFRTKLNGDDSRADASAYFTLPFDTRDVWGKAKVVTITLEPDTEKREVEIPLPLRKELGMKLIQKLNSLSFTHKKEFIVWYSEAKKEDTRARRVEKMKQMLSAGKVIS